MLYLQADRSLYKQVPWQVKKLVAVLATSTLVTEKKEELEQVPCIWLSVTFKDQTKALLDSRSKVNTMNQVFAHQLSCTIRKTNVGAQKIISTTLKTYEIVISTFSILDKDGRERFFEESFLLADVKPKIIFRMPILTMSNADVDFQAWNL